ncbi:MAG: PQQ-binding-like beta-propeller repeat protein [Thermoleophilaceae bacterium]
MRRTTIIPAAAAAALLLAAAAPAYGQAPPACSETDHPGGEWPSYGHDLSNTRSQPEMEAVGAAEVGSLGAAWVHEAPGAINNTPIVTGGCIFVASSDGTVSALDADDGSGIWSTELDPGQAAFGGGLVGSPAVTADSVLVAINREGSPYVASLDRATGEERWRTVVDEQPQSGINASVVVHDGLAFVGFFGSPAPGTEPERGGYVLIEAATGAIAAKGHAIDDESFEQGYAGAGSWSTPAIDPEAGFAYVGTSNPHNPQLEHPRANSLIKVDLNRDSADFGEIVASYKGRPDTYLPGLADQPACDTAPDVHYVPPFSLTCLQIDLDFGASPTLFTDAAGKQRLGGLQKSGDYHVVDPADMSEVWRQTVGIPCLGCNAASPAAADGTVFTAAGPPGQFFALDGASGSVKGVGHLTGPTTYNAVSASNGLVYVVDSAGFLNVFDASNGVQLVKRPLTSDTGTPMSTASSASGVAIARDTVFVAASGYVIALRPGEGSSPLPGLPGLPAPGSGSAILTGPGAAAYGYLTPVMVVEQGGSLSYTNVDAVQHDVVARDRAPDGQPVFKSRLASLGETVPVEGLERTESGTTYPFFCSLHTNMQGQLIVE